MGKEPLRLLLVDDDEDDYLITRDFLSEVQGPRFELEWVTTYDAALAAIGRGGHDVYLFDYRLGERSGLELLREAVATGSKVPMILLTGQGDFEIDLEAMKAGASDYLIKGQIDASSLERSIRYAVERKRSEETLRAAEQRFRLISETLPIGIFETDDTAAFIYTNGMFQKIMRVSLIESYHMSVYQLVHPDEREGVRKEWFQAMEQLSGFSKECRILTSKGEDLWVYFRSSPMFADSGVTFTGTVEDITQRKQSEGALRSSHAQLERALEEIKQTQAQMIQSEKMASIGQLAAGVAHEINNPMGFISSNLRTMDEYEKDLRSLISQYRGFVSEVKGLSGVKNDGAISAALSRIKGMEKKTGIDFVLNDVENLIKDCREGCERIKKIVLALKDFAHPGDQELKDADINHNLESTVNIAWNELKYKATVIKDYGDMPPVLCYPQQLNQVFMNILINAAQAIEKKGQIRIATRAVDGYAEVAISDTGPGIPEKHLPKVFDPFFTTKEVGKGTGLGLNVAYNIVQKHKGTIEVNSTVGVGTTFTIRIPIG